MRFGHIPELLGGVHPLGPEHMSATGRTIAALVDPDRLRRILSRMLDEQEFLSPHGIRSVSRWHEQHPYVVRVDGKEYRVAYQPAESETAMFGGNSNWRGPVWFPMNALLIRALFQFHAYYGDAFRVECPTGSGRLMTLFEVGTEISDRLQRIFLRDEAGRRPVFGGAECSRTIRTGAIAFRSMSTSTATTAPASAPATRPGGPLWLPCSRRCPAPSMPAPCSSPEEAECSHGRPLSIAAPGGRARRRDRTIQRDARVMKIEVLADVESVARHAAEVIAAEARAAVKARGRFAVAISGGRTPWAMLRALSALDVPWANVHVLQVDERIAPEGHATGT